MDIDYLSKMVGELVLDNDEVSLPGVGSFVAELMPASFSDKGYVINPPYRRLSFRQRLEGDSLLIQRYAAEASLTEERAAAELRPFLKELKEVLKEKKVIIFPGLGRLRATKENNFFFVPEESLDIYPEGCLLESVSLKNHIQTKEELSAAVSSLGRLIDERLKSSADTPAEVMDAFLPTIEIEPLPEPSVPVADVSESPLPAAGDPSAAPAAQAEASLPSAAPAVQVEASSSSAAPAGHKRWWRYAAVAAAAVLTFFLVFILLSRIAPGLTDHLLYTKDELYIINYPLP